ncbi:OmpA family protein [Aestuariicoccus sp. MJ-SS9]|uniref:OmpA family protein n=1 Tax=Aestuariicoccus sp. MJ-SS9 TaxID=3079855 RepID=UPI002911139C|nr:OmpA family protein [Aestuariicoccus sp. MJ-SS9]MDU8913661.1 OmpA family protein [Aestuariicoccus sp. MJ-SS9]
MRLSSFFVTFGTFALAGAVSLVAAFFAMQVVEDGSRTGVLNALDLEGLDWADVDANGLQLFVIGEAPNEAERFRALSVAGGVVDAARLIDQMNVVETTAIAPPKFSIEILRNDAGISLIGLLPATTDRERLLSDVQRLGGEGAVSDLLEVADFPAPDGWTDALRYAVAALRDLPRSKMTVEAGSVSIKAMSDDTESRLRLEAELVRRKPEGLRLALDLSSPRPVISPFALRFVLDADGARFNACSADTEEARRRILAAAARAGLEGKTDCTLGLGVPTSRWAEAVEMSIDALAEMGGETLTIADADITIVAVEGTPQAVFDRVVGELENNLPDVFALDAVLPQPPDTEPDQGPPEFVATLSPEGTVQLRGRLNNEIARQTADSFARAAFGSATVYTAARIDDSLPQGWSVRALAALEALSYLSNGAVTVTPDSVAISGNTGLVEAEAEIAALLAEKLGAEQTFDIDVTYQEKLDPLLGIPTPEECEAQIVEIVGDRKITFEPGSATLDASAKDIMDEIAELLKICGEIPLEIQGHTDSQGREVMNQQLSQDRAQAVLNALRDRRVLTSTFRAKGFGEDMPIADNGTEEGREANRRIEFKLIRPEPVEEQQTTLEAVEQSAGDPSAEEGTGDE